MPKQYKTYQEAKLANPECEIIRTIDGYTYTHESDLRFIAVANSPDTPAEEGLAYVDSTGTCALVNMGRCELCKPEDYCITVADFLSMGMKFEMGDAYLGCVGVINISTTYLVGRASTPSIDNSSRYILKAKALDKLVDSTITKWSYGEECIIARRSGTYIFGCVNPKNNERCIVFGGDMHPVDVKLCKLIKPETPEQKEERIRLETAYMLYCKCTDEEELVAFNLFKQCNHKAWLTIMDVTGYTKD